MPKYLLRWKSRINKGETVIFFKCFAFARGGSKKQQHAIHILVGFDPTSLAFGFRLVEPPQRGRRKSNAVDEMIAEHTEKWQAQRKVRTMEAMRFLFQISLGKAVKPVMGAVTRLRQENQKHIKIKKAAIVGAVFTSRYKLPPESPLQEALIKEGIQLLAGPNVVNGGKLWQSAFDFMEHFQDRLDLFLKGFAGDSRSLENELSRVSTGETKLVRKRLSMPESRR